MKKAKLVTCNQGVLTQFRVNVISGTRKWILKPLKIV